MTDDQSARTKVLGQPHAATKNRQEVVIAFEEQCGFAGLYFQCYADTVADVFLKAGWPCKSFRAVNHLWKARLSAILADPKLSVSSDVFGDNHNGRPANAAKVIG